MAAMISANTELLRMIWGFATTASSSTCYQIIEDYVIHGGDNGATEKILRNFCGLKQRKKLEECLRIVCQKKKMKVSFPLFGRKMFSHRKFSRALKQEAIDMFIEQIDPDKSIRMKIKK